MIYGMIILLLVFKTIMEFVKYCHNDDNQFIYFLVIVIWLGLMFFLK